MIKYNIKRYLAIIAVVSILAFLVYIYLFNLSIKEAVSWSISTISFIVLFFIQFAWKWKIFCGWLVPFPNLNGCWKGNLESSFKGTSQKIPVELFIKQTFLHIQIKLGTEESKSNSIAASFNIDTDREIKQLCYSYQNNPKGKLQESSPIHYGSVIFDIESNDEMRGQYWTSRKTVGDITVFRVCDNRKHVK